MKLHGLEVPPEAMIHILQGHKIQAIKVVRGEFDELRDLTLAKGFVEDVERVLNSTPLPAQLIESASNKLSEWMKDVEKRLHELEAINAEEIGKTAEEKS